MSEKSLMNLSTKSGQRKDTQASDSIIMTTPKICTILTPPTPPLPLKTTSDQGSGRKDPKPKSLAVSNRFHWANGKTLRIELIGGSEKVRQKVQQYAMVWTEYANIGMEFVTGGGDIPADIRVSFEEDGKTWSYLGTRCLDISAPEPTMNFGWLNDKTEETEFSRTILHEFGHALGCVHEHQSPFWGIKWDDEQVYDYYARFGWTKDDVAKNIFQRYRKKMVRASKLDRKSIMLYFFSSDFTKNGYSTPYNTELSTMDKQFIAKMYPRRGGNGVREGQNQSTQGASSPKMDGNPITRRGDGQSALKNLIGKLFGGSKRDT